MARRVASVIGLVRMRVVTRLVIRALCVEAEHVHAMIERKGGGGMKTCMRYLRER